MELGRREIRSGTRGDGEKHCMALCVMVFAKCCERRNMVVEYGDKTSTAMWR